MVLANAYQYVGRYYYTRKRIKIVSKYAVETMKTCFLQKEGYYVDLNCIFKDENTYH